MDEDQFEQLNFQSSEHVNLEHVNIKRVQYENSISHSQDSSDHIKKKAKRRNYSKKMAQINDNEESSDQLRKRKNISKNCVSAKKSRQRKKEYIEKLEERAEILKKEIVTLNSNLKQKMNGILENLRTKNPQKSNFIEQSIKQSKLLAKEFSKLDQSKEQEPKTLEKQAKNSQTQYMINSFIYKFGFNGGLRKDVIQHLKAKFFSIAIDQKIISAGYQTELRILYNFQKCMNQLALKNMDMDFILRKLQNKVSQREMIALLIRTEFLNQTGNGKMEQLIKMEEDHEDEIEQED